MSDPKGAPNNSEEHRRACEGREVLRMSEDKRQERYKGIGIKRGQKAVDYLAAEVKRQLELEAQNVMGKDDFTRQSYYQEVLQERGDKGVNELLTEVKRQRRLSKELER